MSIVSASVPLVMPPVEFNPDSILRLKTKSLVDPSDSELESLFASEIAHYPESPAGRWALLVRDQIHRLAPGFDPGPLPVPAYCSSFDLVLPFLDAWRDRPYLYRMGQIDLTPDGWLVKLVDMGARRGEDREIAVQEPGTDLARCAVIALLRAAGWNIEFPKKS